MRFPLLSLFLFSLLSLLPSVFSFYGPSDGVVDLTAANFDSEVMKSDSVWLVEFYAPWCGHCKNLIPEYTKVGKALNGIAKVGAVDMTKHESVGQKYGVQSFPTIKIFGGNKKSPIDYNGERTASAFIDSVLKEATAVAKGRIGQKPSASSGSSNSGGNAGGKAGGNGETPGSKVLTLTDSNFDSLVLQSDDLLLVEFYAPWCGHCKNLAPHWENAAKELAKQDIPIKLAALDATAYGALASKYGIKGYPTIKIFKPGKKNSPEDYNGPREKDGIVAFAKNLAESAAPPPPPKKILQITDLPSLQSTCGEGSGNSLCVVAFLPHILDSKATGRNGYLNTLKEVSAKLSRKPIAFFWSEAGAQYDFESQLNVGGSGYPAISVLNLKKGKFSNMRGAMTSETVDNFLKDVQSGKEPVESLQGEPKISKVDQWDGKDGKPPADDEL